MPTLTSLMSVSRFERSVITSGRRASRFTNGLYIFPPFPMAPTYDNNWSGERSKSPCPIETLYVSPKSHGVLVVSSFHSADGKKPEPSPGRSTPIFFPRLNFSHHVCNRVMPKPLLSPAPPPTV